MKVIVFWDVAPCSLSEIDRRFIAMMMEAVSTSETSVNFHETTERNIEERKERRKETSNINTAEINCLHGPRYANPDILRMLGTRCMRTIYHHTDTLAPKCK
jgi:hypothetical protein